MKTGFTDGCRGFIARNAGRPLFWLAPFLVCIVVLTAAGIQAASDPPSRRSSGERNDQATRGETRLPNVVIFLVDTLRADVVGSYGSIKEVTPTMDNLARRGVVFEQAAAPAPWTLPSVVSLMLSQFVLEHHVVRDGDKIHPTSTTLAQRFRRMGYRTASFYVNPYAGSMSGLNQGFDTCGLRRKIDGPLVSDWIESHENQPFFMYLHAIEPHDPFRAPQEFVRGEVSGADRKRLHDLSWRYRRLTRADFDAGRALGKTDNTDGQRQTLSQLDEMYPMVQRLYSGSVRQADVRLASVIDALKKADVWSNTLFIVTSDHGEEMGDHGMWFHDQSVQEELIHVPLIVRFPNDLMKGRRIETPVSLVDLGPTILDFLSAAAQEWESDGRSLMPLIDDHENHAGGGLRVVSVRNNRKKYSRVNREMRGDLNIVVREGKWKGVFNVEIGEFDLYDLEKDPFERHEIADRNRSRARRMRSFAACWMRRYRE